MTVKIGDKFYSRQAIKHPTSHARSAERGGIVTVLDVGQTYVVVQSERGRQYNHAPTIRKKECVNDWERAA